MKAYHLKINKMGVMGSILDVEVAHHCKTVCAVNLHLKEIFKNVWAFAIAIDAGNNARFQLQNYLVERQQIVYSIEEVGGFVQISMDELRSSGNAHDMETHDKIVSTIANFSLQIVAGISKACGERDNQNSSADQLPPVLPLDLCSVHSRDFTSCSK